MKEGAEKEEEKTGLLYPSTDGKTPCRSACYEEFGAALESSNDEEAREGDSITCSVDGHQDGGARDDDSVAFSVTGKDDSKLAAEPSNITDGGDDRCDVIILGAGAAGIGAARSLLSNDATLRVIVVEARNRPGGRAWTSDELGSGVDLDHGARWMHGSKEVQSKPVQNSAIDLDLLQATASFDTTDSDDDHDGNSSSDDDTYYHHPNDEYRMLWNTEGYLERVAVGEPNRYNTGVKNATSSKHFSFKRGDVHYQAAKFLYRELCRLSGSEEEGSQIDSVKEGLPREATYKDCLDELARREAPDQTFDEWVYARAEKALQFLRQRGGPSGLPPPRPHDVHQVIAILHVKLYRFYENYERALWSGILDKISLQLGKKSGRTEPRQNADVSCGYGRLVTMLATLEVPTTNNDPSATPTNIDIRYNQQATSVVQTSEGIRVRAVGTGGVNHRYIAQSCICAAPLGVLQQQQNLAFVPPLPDHVALPLNRLSMGLMNKIEVLFPARWWPRGAGVLDVASYSLDDALDKTAGLQPGDIPWSQWIVERDDPAIIVCYVVGEIAERIETMSNDEVQAQAVEALRSAFVYDGSNVASIPDPVRTYCTKWQSDPHSRGSWTLAPASTEGMKDVSAFQAYNEENDRNLYFAGEHTCDGSIGGLDIATVHGAYISGVKAASELLARRRCGQQQEREERDGEEGEGQGSGGHAGGTESSDAREQPDGDDSSEATEGSSDGTISF